MLKIFSNIFLLVSIVKFILEMLEFKKIQWNLLLVRKVGKVVIFIMKSKIVFIKNVNISMGLMQKLFFILEINLVKYKKIISNPLIKVRNKIIEYT